MPHITEILDRSAFVEISAADRSEIEAHIVVCQSCRQAFRAAELSSMLLKNDASAVSSAPFFQAKVINAWREKQNPSGPSAAFKRWRQAAAAPVWAMLLTVITLIGVSIFAPVSNADQSQARQTTDYPYTTDAVILDQKTSAADFTTEQIFQMLDARRDEEKRINGQRK